ncbi:uncharacterized protein LOC129322643 isoform X2 [Prosopis cineraria]|uniref:uncharacterized protein LOC129322643 isoform X2 n=1 Tax=Prosopis cineraria TaxID=364024 RepID=UPI00240F0639|nr:uncharacterized protein LOC129322643 isoform X2 [Prosopis cineraria]
MRFWIGDFYTLETIEDLRGVPPDVLMKKDELKLEILEPATQSWGIKDESEVLWPSCVGNMWMMVDSSCSLFLEQMVGELWWPHKVIVVMVDFEQARTPVLLKGHALRTGPQSPPSPMVLLLLDKGC